MAGNPLDLPAVPSLASLYALLDRSPELRRFADEERLRDARVQLARLARTSDIQWHAGVRRLEATDDWAAVAGVSMSLGSARRAEPRVRAAEAELAALSLERESEKTALYATLSDAHAHLDAASVEVDMARTDVLPRLERAEQAAERAYRAGALSYLEWAQVESEMFAVRRDQVLTAIDAHKALIEIQRLTGEPFVASGTSSRPEIQP
ncbi:MAG: TolC family protein [Gammaproteobacteria bacterium]